MAQNIFVGFDEFEKKVYVSPDDRAYGMQIVGSPGTGKSKLMEHMMRQDTLANHGYALIDPHASCYHPLLRWFCFHQIHWRDIVLVNPSEGKRITFFNPFASVTEKSLSVQVDNRIKATLRAWGLDSSDETPTLERWLRVIYTVISLNKDLTINDSYYFVEHEEKIVREYLSQGNFGEALRGIRAQLNKLSRYKEKDFDEKLLSTLNKFFRFITAEPITSTMGMPDLNIDIEDIVENNKILLVNIQPSDCFSSEHSSLLGGQLVNEFVEYAQKRPEKSEPFYLYIDECHRFLSHDFATILDECRKRGLHMIFAHQNLSQVEDKGGERVLASVLGSARMKAIFGDLPRKDADVFLENCFKINVDEVKKIHYGTKFWPLYKRDKVYAHGQSESSGSSSQAGTSSTTGADASKTAFGILESGGGFDSTSKAWSEADIPILIPVPYLEKIKEETWSIEEQKQMISDRLMFNFERHCFWRFPARTAKPHLVPFVPDYPIDDIIYQDYEYSIYEKFSEWLPAEEVPPRIKARTQRLLTEAQKFHNLTVHPEDRSEKAPKVKAKKPPVPEAVKRLSHKQKPKK